MPYSRATIELWLSGPPMSVTIVGVDGADGEVRVTIDVRGHGPMAVRLDQIADAKLLITDRLIAATAPISTEGADEFIEVPGDGAPFPDNDDTTAEDTH